MRKSIATRAESLRIRAIKPLPTPDQTYSAAPIDAPADFDPDGALSREYLLQRGRCCQEGCRNCPYGDIAPDAEL